jgi:hypothetical protein
MMNRDNSCAMEIEEAGNWTGQPHSSSQTFRHIPAVFCGVIEL